MKKRCSRRRRGFSFAAFWTAVLLLLTACAPAASPGPQETRLDFFAMDTYISLRAWGSDRETLQRAKEKAEALEALLSVTRENSEVFRLNETGSAALSPETAAVLEKALALCRETEGVFDISVYPIVRAWGFTTGEYRVPEAGELAALLERVDYTKIELREETVSLPAGMAIDLGGVAKGWAGDRMADLLRSHGVQSAILDLGGNIQTVGTKPDGSFWRVAIRDPAGSGILGTLSAADCAVVTSGGYERYFTDENGGLHWHIMDPRTGESARNGLISVTVTGPEGARCDALSTALFVMGPERAAAFWREKRDFGTVLVTEDGKVLLSPDLAAAFTPAEGSGYTYEVIPDDEN